MTRRALATLAGKIGIIVIGRNEGSRLYDALSSLPTDTTVHSIYVDSGSYDGSVDVARTFSVDIHQLDAARPFSAARARREGVEFLLTREPEVELIHFLDGDCALHSGWIEEATVFLEQNDDVAAVCGLLTERHPERSVYNWLSSFQWNNPTGDVEACGGIFMIRRGDYLAAGGFDPSLLTREEFDLFDRVRSTNRRIVRIDRAMASHDSSLLSFGQWWNRAVWGGYGDALHISSFRGNLKPELRQRVRRYIVWPVALPIVFVAGVVAAPFFVWMLLLPASCLGAYMMLFVRIALEQIRSGSGVRNAGLYSLFRIIRKFATGFGFFSFFVRRDRLWKPPDPHAPVQTGNDRARTG